ncbi:hypothetical protein EDC01DRAFT_653656 [Geopyxis carbonaria]|nr:hypothetical protein EDC01DRAFT_653656 [Geopyxis carbonaria]
MPNNSQTIKQGGWSDRQNFQASYGLGMDPDGIAEGNSIRDALQQADAERAAESTAGAQQQQSASNAGGQQQGGKGGSHSGQGKR